MKNPKYTDLDPQFRNDSIIFTGGKSTYPSGREIKRLADKNKRRANKSKLKNTSKSSIKKGF
jgi:hypothetical protein